MAVWALPCANSPVRTLNSIVITAKSRNPSILSAMIYLNCSVVGRYSLTNSDSDHFILSVYFTNVHILIPYQLN